MNDFELNLLLNKASNPPDCPTDKFIAQFNNLMDGQNIPEQNTIPFWQGNIKQISAIAASLVVVFGVSMYGMQKTNINTNAATNNDALVEVIYTDEDYSDEFAASIIGEDDISNIIAYEDL